jgi:hypothetical protein
MEWDLGIEGLGVLALLSLAFGALAQLFFLHRATWWVWLAGTVAFFAGGLLISEAWFGWATAAELQPNIDGLSFDEVLLIGFGFGIPIVLGIRYFVGRQHGRRPTTT